MTVAGAFASYLWYNAEPSEVLMGDAGSRMLGLAIGVAVLATGNPLLIFVFAPMVVLDGGTGLVKVALLRVFKLLGFDRKYAEAALAAGRSLHGCVHCW